MFYYVIEVRSAVRGLLKFGLNHYAPVTDIREPVRELIRITGEELTGISITEVTQEEFERFNSARYYFSDLGV